MVSIFFYLFGFSVNDLQTGTRLMRCDSTGDLYPLFSNSQAISSKNQSAFTALPSDIWHNRLGHPGHNILKSLCNKKLIDCNRLVKFFVLLVLLGNILGYLSMIRYLILFFRLILFIVNFGLLLLLVLPAIVIMFSFLMTTTSVCGPFL